MRLPTDFRPLEPLEIDEAIKVFWGTISSYPEIYLSDGMGSGDVPFAMPSKMNIPVLGIPATRFPGKFVIFIGDAFHKHLNSKDRVPGETYTYAELLIHELTHVWQFEHGYAVISNSLAHRVMVGEEMYKYSRDKYLAWNAYNVEQQAQIVEDWYGNGMQDYDPSTGKGDIRYTYIKQNIRGEVHDTLAPLPPPWEGIDMTRPDPVFRKGPQGITDPLKDIMAPRYGEGDPRSVERVKKLEELFRRTSHPKALLARLQAKAAGDKGAADFHHILHPATIVRLLKILRDRA